MMGSSSMIKIFLATSAVASPKLVVLSVLIYLGSSQTLRRHRFPKWALSGIDGDKAARQDGGKNAGFALRQRRVCRNDQNKNIRKTEPISFFRIAPFGYELFLFSIDRFQDILTAPIRETHH